MKAFWFTVALFLILLGCVFLNARFLRRTSEELIGYADQLTEVADREKTVTALERCWDDTRTWISLTVSFQELDHFGELVAQLRWAHDTKNETELIRYRSLLIDAAEELSRTEQFSIENLF